MFAERSASSSIETLRDAATERFDHAAALERYGSTPPIKHVAHIIDDASLGGVNRLLDSLISSLSDHYRHTKLMCRKPCLPPRNLRADIIVIHFTAAWRKLPFLLALRSCNAGARLILVEHSYTAGYEAKCVPYRSRFRAMLKLAYRCVDQVIAVSHGQARWIIDAKLASPQHVTIIPCVLDLAPFQALPLPEPRSPLVLGAFGRFHRQKGFDTLLEAMRRVDPSRARLMLAGYGADEAVLRAAAADLAHVVVRGRVDPIAFLTDVDAIVIPSRWEAGAVTCWEARAAARPLIVTSVDSLPEQVPPSIGYIVPPEDPEALSAAIDRLADGDRGEMAKEARRSTTGAYANTLNRWRSALEGFGSPAAAETPR